MPSRPIGPTGQRVFAGVFFLVGAFLATYLGPQTLQEARATRTWVQVQGEVVGSRVVNDTRASGKGYEYDLEVEYRYRFGDQDYTSDQLAVGRDWSFDKRGQAEVAQSAFQPGTPLPVFVNPEDPASAVLERGGEDAAELWIGMGVLFMAAGLVVFRYAKTRTRSG